MSPAPLYIAPMLDPWVYSPHARSGYVGASSFGLFRLSVTHLDFEYSSLVPCTPWFSALWISAATLTFPSALGKLLYVFTAQECVVPDKKS